MALLWLLLIRHYRNRNHGISLIQATPFVIILLRIAASRCHTIVLCVFLRLGFLSRLLGSACNIEDILAIILLCTHPYDLKELLPFSKCINGMDAGFLSLRRVHYLKLAGRCVAVLVAGTCQ